MSARCGLQQGSNGKLARLRIALDISKWDAYTAFTLASLEALQAATVTPARLLGLDDSLRTVEAGKPADLILLDANPPDDIRNTQDIEAVVADGRLYRRADLDASNRDFQTPKE